MPFQVLTPMIATDNAGEAIEWYKRAFDAVETLRLEEPSGRIGHAQLAICGGEIMVADKAPGYNHTPSELGASTVVLHLNVPNVDEFIDQAVDAGAELLMEPADQFYGQRSGRIKDPYGHIWLVSTTIEDVDKAEMKRRFAAFF